MLTRSFRSSGRISNIIINEWIRPVADRRFKDGSPTSNHSVAFSNYLLCVERRKDPSFAHCNLHVFLFLDHHWRSKSSQGICMDVFTSANVSDVTDIKLLLKWLCLVVVRQQIRLPDFIFRIHLVDDQLGVPKGFQHGDTGFEGEFQSYNQGLVLSCIIWTWFQ